MTVIVLTEYDGAILGPIAKLLGYLMNGIFNMLYAIGIPNIGLSIIIFTIVIYLLLMPMTIRQQKFSKLSALMNPEMNAIRKKYEGKKDQDSMMKMNEETKLLYAKYGVSPTGSCGFMLIQMPILFALYRVIDNIPAYVTRVKEVFDPFVSELIHSKEALSLIDKDNFSAVARFNNQITSETFQNFVQGLNVSDSNAIEYVKNTIIDILNKASTAEWENIFAKVPSLEQIGRETYEIFKSYNNFLGINIANSPSYLLKEGWDTKSFMLIIGAIMIPLLSALTQWLNVKLTPQTNSESTGNEQQDSMMRSMKTMNIMMPAMSAVFCFSLPAGMGIYWIAGSVVRCIQQVAINKYLDKEDINEMIAKNAEKMKKKNSKKGPSLLEKYANMSTKSLEEGSAGTKQRSIKDIAGMSGISSKAEPDTDPAVSTEQRSYKPGGIAEKANLVRKFNENSD